MDEIVNMTESNVEMALPARADPFAERQGKTLTWRNVNMIVEKKKGDCMHILDSVWGEAPRKQTTAILGPSGSGKTSLLHVLSEFPASGFTLEMYVIH